MTRIRGIDGIDDVVASHLCAGCGVCAGVQPVEIRMTDSPDGQRRPVLLGVPGHGPPSTQKALAACPGIRLEHRSPGDGAVMDPLWGPILEVWEGWSTDPEIRYNGSSGGAVTAIALHELESGSADGVLHSSAPLPNSPYASRTVVSRSRDDLLLGIGSRYAPASPGERLGEVSATGEGTIAFIGKPCDAAGAVMAAENDPSLTARLGLVIAIFCAGTPSWQGTREAIARAGADPGSVTEVRYRGHGWPGRFVARDRDGQEFSLSYAESWGEVLQRHRQWRCRICPDHTGEFADIAVGDPWYREIEPGDPGRSLVVVRTERGRDAVRSAIEDGAVDLQRVEPSVISASQPGLISVRGSVWGRIATMRLLGMPIPVYEGFPIRGTWLRELRVKEKLQSTVGTARRVRSRGLRKAARGRDPKRKRNGERD